jgi:hypothetical protein
VHFRLSATAQRGCDKAACFTQVKTRCYCLRWLQWMIISPKVRGDFDADFSFKAIVCIFMF